MMENRESADGELFTASQVAKFCHVDLKTIHNWVQKGQIRHFRTPGRHLRFRRLDLLDFLHRYGYPVPDALRGGKPKVVVVDADVAVLTSVKRALGRRFDVTTFTDIIEALVAIGAALPDALILDPRMSGIDGANCIEKLRGSGSTGRMRIVAYSADETDRRSLLEKGANDFISKGELALLREAMDRLTGQ